jgi:DNA-binding beta-propeller fold protein YncE
VSADGKTLYTAYGDPENTRADDIIRVDIATGRQGRPIPVANQPVGLAVAPNGGDLYVIGNDNDLGVTGPHSLSVVDLSAGRTVSRVTLGLTPIGLTVGPGGRVVFVQGNNNTIDAVSPAAGKIVTTLHDAGTFHSTGPLGGDFNSYCLVLSPDGRTLFASNGAAVAVIPVSGLTS